MTDIVMGIVGAIGGASLLSDAHVLIRGQMIYTIVAATMGVAILAELARCASERLEHGSTD